jgi:hypothetical protein
VTDARLVNLVWRHLATDPAVFEWGLARRAARAEVRLSAGPGATTARTGRGLGAGMAADQASRARHDISGCRSSAHRGANLLAYQLPQHDGADLAVGARVRVAAKDLRQAADHATKWTPPLLEPPEPTELPDLPRLPAWQQLDAGTLLEIQQLNLMGESEAPRVVASLYRHLALWPPVLAMAAQALAPLQQAGLLLAERIATAQRADALLDQTLPAPRPAPAAFNAQFAPFLRQLRSVTIAKMIPIGCLLQQLLQQHCDAARPAVQFHVSPAESITANKPPGIAASSTTPEETNMLRQSFVVVSLALPLAISSAPAAAQAWPNQPVSMIVSFPPGGVTDLVGRALAAEMSKSLGQQVVVVNRGGAAGTIGANAIVHARPTAIPSASSCRRR